MAAKNSVKIYAPDSYYHLYNRGVAKNEIFLDSADYSTFLSYLKIYLSPKNEAELTSIRGNPQSGYREKYEAAKLLALKNYYQEIELLAYALMPNHFHFLVKQKEANSIDNFMNSLGTRYSGFFNRKYHRVGPIFKGVYKAVLVETDAQLLHLSRYIHLNSPKQTSPSSFPEYLGQRHTAWIKTDQILSYFQQENPQTSYQKFVQDYADIEPIVPLTLDIEDS